MSKSHTARRPIVTEAPPSDLVPDASDKPRWVSRLSVSRALGISYENVANVAYAANIRVKQIPGLRGVRFFQPDVERLARDVISHAKINRVEPPLTKKATRSAKS